MVYHRVYHGRYGRVYRMVYQGRYGREAYRVVYPGWERGRLYLPGYTSDMGRDVYTTRVYLRVR